MCKICDGSEQAAGACLVLLEDGAKFRSERDAVFHIDQLIMLFRNEQLAARYIIGRFALYKADEADPTSAGPNI